ncbi:redoxin domain-containing protein [Pedobacter sp. Leaf176]|uniref:redoxin domain-containing protein n=1 Tax=Pedobacter sp. Leaf176 TaxID=1736286 RepID=UPI0006FA67CF|nr:redoxin domain-containing protein [Pedobacter sp. Leaf176]KQR66846.1 hypothetical protein ASF92_19010 [Pedobacter sp. Leaf176]
MKIYVNIFIGLLFYLTKVLGQSPAPKSFLWQQIKASAIVNIKNEMMLSKQANTAFIFISPECPLSRNYVLVLNELSQKYPNVNIVGVVPGRSYSDKEIKDFAQSNNVGFEIYSDKKKSLTKLLKASVTPEAVLIDAKGKIRYRGLIDNWPASLGVKRKVITFHYLEDALKDINVENFKYIDTKPVGCLINDL